MTDETEPKRSFVMFRRLATAALLSVVLASPALSGEAKHRLAIQVDQNDPQVMNLALNNATNVIEYYRAKNEDVDLDIVTYGPGLHMLRADTSPVKDRLKRLKELAFPGNVQFSTCNNTKQGMEKTEGKEVPILSEARGHHRPLRCGPADGIAGEGLELRPPLM
jgi:intracellular sulfur oxidation DsrE/DsrF family protein